MDPKTLRLLQEAEELLGPGARAILKAALGRHRQARLGRAFGLRPGSERYPTVAEWTGARGVAISEVGEAIAMSTTDG